MTAETAAIVAAMLLCAACALLLAAVFVQFEFDGYLPAEYAHTATEWHEDFEAVRASIPEWRADYIGRPPTGVSV